MFSDKITLDRETLKVLAADTRIEILKRLAEHKETLTDIAEGMKLSPSTVKEHLDRLSQAGLIEQIDSDTKWKYYRHTRQGEHTIKPYEANVLILLSAALLALVGLVYSLLGNISSGLAAYAPKLAAESSLRVMDKAAAPEMAASVPYGTIALVVFSSILVGACLTRLNRK